MTCNVNKFFEWIWHDLYKHDFHLVEIPRKMNEPWFNGLKCIDELTMMTYNALNHNGSKTDQGTKN